MSNRDVRKASLTARLFGGVAGVVLAAVFISDLPAGHLSDAATVLIAGTILISGFVVGVSVVWVWERL